ncbi:VWA domain-containing protein [Arachidicoccus sp.]|uniref:VWA domain-containing protein n=1 Tax=Arachidicoccus sp. TaxID=1872624 RepID=UPI003D1F92EC
MLSFENSTYLWWLLALVPVVFLFVSVIKWKQQVKKNLGDAVLIKRLTAKYSPRLFRIKFYVIIIALFIGIFTLSNLRKSANRGVEQSSGIDIIIALDVSKSMLSQDIKPTRIDRAKQLINQLTDNLYNNRVGLEVFAGQAILQMPLTDDVGAIKMYLSNINTDMVPIAGTAIGDALNLANNALDSNDRKHKAVILLTDGEDHDAKTEDAVKNLYNHGVVVFTVGIGTAQGSPILDPVTNEYKKDKDGNTVISKLNEKELQNIASSTGGSYLLLNNDATAVKTITSKINAIEKKLIVSGKVGNRQYFYYFPYLIALVLLLLVIELFIPERKKELV